MVECVISTVLSFYWPAMGHLRLHPHLNSNLSILLHHYHRRKIKKRPRDEPTDTKTVDKSGAGPTLLTTIAPARKVRLNFYIFASRGEHTKFESGLQSATYSQSGGSAWSYVQDKHIEESKALRQKHDPALHICRTQAACNRVVKI